MPDQPFNPATPCSACGFNAKPALTLFIDGVKWYPPNGTPDMRTMGEAREAVLRRQCQRCHFEWDEKPLVLDPTGSLPALIEQSAQSRQSAWTCGANGCPGHNSPVDVCAPPPQAKQEPTPPTFRLCQRTVGCRRYDLHHGLCNNSLLDD